jgi:hypothetical protein
MFGYDPFLRFHRGLTVSIESLCNTEGGSVVATKDYQLSFLSVEGRWVYQPTYGCRPSWQWEHLAGGECTILKELQIKEILSMCTSMLCCFNDHKKM